MPVEQYSNIPGIPDPRKFGDPSRVLREGELAPFAIQQHKAVRAGKHFDVRVGPGQMMSWATRKPMPEPGGKISLFQTPLHSETYGTTFEGDIPMPQYGAGNVKIYEKGRMLVQHASPDKINIVAAHRRFPMRYTLIRDKKTPRKWLLINTTPTSIKQIMGKGVKHVMPGARVEEALGIKKQHYKKEPVEKIESLLSPDATFSEKIDGSALLYKIMKDRVEAVSYRTSKSGLPIVHTERMQMPRNIKIPPELVGSILRGEAYGVRGITEKAAVAPVPVEQNVHDKIFGAIGL